MATKLYFCNADPEYTPPTIRGAWDSTAGSVAKRLDPIPQGSIATVSAVETSTDGAYDQLLFRGISPPLAAQTVSGSLTLLMPVRESAVAADLYFHVHVYVTQGDSDAVRGTLLSDWVQTAGSNEWDEGYGYYFYGRTTGALTLSDVVASAGDRVVTEIGYIARNTVATSYTGYLAYGGDASVADLSGTSDYYYHPSQLRKGYLTFSADLGWVSQPVRGSQLATESLQTFVSELRISQAVAEALVLGPVPLQASQLAAEILEENPAAPVGGVGGSFLWID